MPEHEMLKLSHLSKRFKHATLRNRAVAVNTGEDKNRDEQRTLR